MAKITVCVPVYNVEQYIGRCIESIQNQSFKDIEIVVINDSTPDSSMDIVKQYAAEDGRIKTFEHDVNHGLMMARRTGYMAATGDFITFCDSDDTLPVDALENLYNEAVRKKADIVSGVIEYIPIEGRSCRWKNQLLYGSDKISVYKSLLRNEFEHNLCSRLFRRGLLQDHNYVTYEKATNGEDGMLFYQVVEHATKVVEINNVVYEYRQNVRSSSQVRLNDTALRSIALLNDIRVKTAGKYTNLSALLNKKISYVYWDLKSNGYQVEPFFKNVGLNDFCKFSSLIKEQGIFKAIKLLLKLFLNTKNKS